MTTKADLEPWTLDAVKAKGGRAHHIEVAKQIWEDHEEDLRRSGDLFYSWQYDLRWAAQRLQDKGKLRKIGSTGFWELR